MVCRNWLWRTAKNQYRYVPMGTGYAWFHVRELLSGLLIGFGEAVHYT